MRLKFELTNQDSAGRKNYTVLASKKGIEFRRPFSLETSFDIHEKG